MAVKYGRASARLSAKARGRERPKGALRWLAACILAFSALPVHGGALLAGQAERLVRGAGQDVRVLIVDSYASAARESPAIRDSIKRPQAQFDGKNPLDGMLSRSPPIAGSLTVPGVPPVCAIVLPSSLDDPVSVGMRKQGIANDVVRRFVAYHELWHCMENAHRGASVGAGSVFTRALPRFGSPSERGPYQEVGADLFALNSMADEGRPVSGLLRALRRYRALDNAYDGRCLTKMSAVVFRKGALGTRIDRTLRIRADYPACWGQGAGAHR